MKTPVLVIIAFMLLNCTGISFASEERAEIIESYIQMEQEAKSLLTMLLNQEIEIESNESIIVDEYATGAFYSPNRNKPNEGGFLLSRDNKSEEWQLISINRAKNQEEWIEVLSTYPLKVQQAINKEATCNPGPCSY
ncbi:MAG: hypothetical protein HC921_17490 [Synechococcaceae cyanobacterium SM2_3_1]|nr:hypothetical protein [Synechococcaceae cyanobacterium SM2_3_1]